MRRKPLLRYRWSHLSPVHRFAVRVYNSLMTLVPFALKYRIGQRLRKRNPPYSLIEECDVVVQIGAPRDTLEAGRSRGMYFALLNRSGKATVIIEPDPENLEAVRRRSEALSLENVSLVGKGAWSERTTLKLWVDRHHPAANFTEKPPGYDEERLADFDVEEVPVDTVDSMLAERGITEVDLVSITTNGAEQRILHGMRRTIEAGVPYLCLARTSDSHVDLMDELGYELLSHDDRGYTFVQKRVG